MTSLIDDSRIGDSSSGETSIQEPQTRDLPRIPRPWLSPQRLVLLLLALLVISQFLVVVPAGERGVLLHFGAVQDTVLGEGLHPLS